MVLALSRDWIAQEAAATLIDASRVSSFARIRQRGGVAAIDAMFNGLAKLSWYQPLVRPSAFGVSVVRNLQYGSDPAHRLDVYLPPKPQSSMPVLFYAHGGGFRILSKETHWFIALMFARRGFVVFNIDYRLAPVFPYPAAIEDACRAYLWMLEHLGDYGGDPRRIALAGESAGANLVTSVSAAATYRREEPWARAVWDAAVVPKVVVPACGIFQVSQVERFLSVGPIHPLEYAYIREVSRSYLPHPGAVAELADPLLLFEREAPERPLPAFFIPAGTADPLVHDSRRLAQALGRRGAEVRARYFADEPHAFHAYLWRQSARQCWQEKLAFMRAQLGDGVEAL